MAEEEQEKQSIERAIVRARDGVGDRIDELDHHLRTNLNPKTLAQSYAPQIIAGGAVLGLIIGFGVPKVFRRMIVWGVPIALVAVAVKNRRNGEQPPGLLAS
ncbi:MAG: hypothetical protein DMF56_13290 [Acidobacteria bacterium]|nr:MAG: hypothetical protein DMF56_13290 [Acidobacteriota bacterium]